MSTNKKLPVTVLSGFLGSGKTTLLQRILTQSTGKKIAVIVNDMSEINIDAALVKAGDVTVNRATETLVELSNGCICCTLREDLLVEISRLAKENRYDYLVIESTGISEPLPVAETFTFVDEAGVSLSDVATLDTMVTVVDAVHFFDNMASVALLKTQNPELDDDDDRSIVNLLVDQIEFSNVILVNKSDQLDAQTVKTICHAVSVLNPSATVIPTVRCEVSLDQILNTGKFDFEAAAEAPGWLKEMRGEHTPETEEYGISSLTYRARRPFHPMRFMDFLKADIGDVYRIKGYFWLATRMDQVGYLAVAGKMAEISQAGVWWDATPESEWPEDQAARAEIFDAYEGDYGDRRQELVFIGVRLNHALLTERLEASLLTPHEMAHPDAWPQLEDPFHDWMVPEPESEETV